MPHNDAIALLIKPLDDGEESQLIESWLAADCRRAGWRVNAPTQETNSLSVTGDVPEPQLRVHELLY